MSAVPPIRAQDYDAFDWHAWGAARLWALGRDPRERDEDVFVAYDAYAGSGGERMPDGPAVDMTGGETRQLAILCKGAATVVGLAPRGKKKDWLAYAARFDAVLAPVWQRGYGVFANAGNPGMDAFRLLSYLDPSAAIRVLAAALASAADAAQTSAGNERLAAVVAEIAKQVDEYGAGTRDGRPIASEIRWRDSRGPVDPMNSGQGSTGSSLRASLAWVTYVLGAKTESQLAFAGADLLAYVTNVVQSALGSVVPTRELSAALARRARELSPEPSTIAALARRWTIYARWLKGR